MIAHKSIVFPPHEEDFQTDCLTPGPFWVWTEGGWDVGEENPRKLNGKSGDEESTIEELPRLTSERS